MLQSALLGLLVALLPMYGLFPTSVAGYLPTVDPSTASPKILLLVAFATSVGLCYLGGYFSIQLSQTRR